MENSHIWETTLEDLTYYGGCQAHNSRVDSFVKSLSASIQIHEIYCECSLGMAVMIRGSLDREVGRGQLISVLHWGSGLRNYHRKGRFRWPVDMHCNMTID
jgi:hypothetical protein